MKYLLNTLLLFTLSIGYAQQQTPIIDRKEGNELIVTPAPILSVTDPKYSQLQANINTNDFTSVKTAVNIRIGFNDETGNVDAYNTIYSATVKLLITRYDINGNILASSLATPNPETKDFVVTHNNVIQNAQYKDFIVYKIPGTHKATAQIISVKYFNESNTLTTINKSPLFVELVFNTDRYFNIKGANLIPTASLVTFTGQTASIVNLTGDTPTNGEDELQISWIKDPIAPAVEYELEWTWIDLSSIYWLLTMYSF